jgi:2-polyprenyl-3-methyl-5-hydroxy-6-metoxy-1,4-benzoquinol methylase
MDETQKAADIFNKLAEGYQDKFMDVSLYADSFDFFCENIPNPNANILEIACGPGNITRFLLEKRPDFRILGTDLAPNMLHLAKINNPTANFILMDARNIATINEKYQAVVCGFCLPYLTKMAAIQFIKDAADRLETQGLLYISTMEDDYSASGFEKGSTGDEIFMHYHEFDYLNTAMQANNMNIIHIERKHYNIQKGKKVTDLILIAQKIA